MALTPSTMLELGTPLPAFSLPAVAGGSISSADLHGRPLLLMVICSHCPFVKHVEPELSRLEQDYGTAVQLLAVSSNSLITHPQDGPEQLADQAKRWGWSFPYLLDEEQSLAKALRAVLGMGDHAVARNGEQRDALAIVVFQAAQFRFHVLHKWAVGTDQHHQNWTNRQIVASKGSARGLLRQLAAHHRQMEFREWMP